MKQKKSKSINIYEILDYARCPMFYKNKYVEKIVNNDINIFDEYDLAIKSIISYAFMNKKFNLTTTIYNLKLMWGKLWIKDKRKTAIAYSETLGAKNYYTIKRRDGIQAIMFLYNNLLDNDGVILDVNKAFEIKINNCLSIAGMFEVIKQIDNKIIFYIFETNDSFNNELFLDFNLKISLIEYAAFELFNTEGKEIYVKVISLKKKKGYEKKISKENLKNDYLMQSIKDIYKCIYNNIFYLCPSEKCISCKYKTMCKI